MEGMTSGNPIDEVMSLQYWSAGAVGKHMKPLDIVSKQLDDSLYKRVLDQAFPGPRGAGIFMKTLKLQGGDYSPENTRRMLKKVKSIRQVGFMLVAEIADNEEAPSPIRVTVEFANQEITAASCSKCESPHGCLHVYVAILYRFFYDVKIHSPLTEGLHTMDTPDLSKIIIRTINKDPLHLIDLIHECAEEIEDEEKEGDPDTMNLIHDPTISEPRLADMFAIDAIHAHFSNNIKEFRLKIVLEYDWQSRWRLEDEIKRAVELGTMNTTSPLPLIYLIVIGEHLASISDYLYHKLHGDPDDTTHLFLHDLKCNLAYVFPQKHRPITISTVDLERLKTVLEQCQDLCTNCEIWHYILPCSPWVELPGIYPLYADKVEEIFGLDRQHLSIGCLVSEALASLFIPPAPQEYTDLIDGKVSPVYSTYNEPLAVMMVRANVYATCEPLHLVREPRSWIYQPIRLLTKDEKEQLRIVERILIELAKMALKYSILSVVGKHIDPGTCRDMRDKYFLKFVMEHSQGITLTPKHAKCSKNTTKPNADVKTTQNEPTTSNQTTKRYSTTSSGCTAAKRYRMGRSEGHTTEDCKVGDSVTADEGFMETANLGMVGKSAPHAGRVEGDGSDVEYIGESVTIDDLTSANHGNMQNDAADTSNFEANVHDEDHVTLQSLYEDVVGTVYPTYNVSETYISPDTVPPGQGLTKGQLAYCLLYWVIRRDDLIQDEGGGEVDEALEDIIHGIHFLAIELSRYSLTTKRTTLYSKELHLLETMEARVCRYIYNIFTGRGERMKTSHTYSFEYIHWVYMSAWWNIGYAFYGESLPFVLVNNVLSKGYTVFESQSRAYFGIPEGPTRDKIRLLMMCDFVMFEEKDTYTFHKKRLGPYTPPEHKPPRRFPLEDIYDLLVGQYLKICRSKNEPDFDCLVFSKLEQVIENCFSTRVKTIPRAMWRALKKKMYYSDRDFREALTYGVRYVGMSADKFAEETEILMIRLSLRLCDLYSCGKTAEPGIIKEKFCQTFIASCKTLGIDTFGLIRDMVKNKTWEHYIPYVHMEVLLRYFEADVHKLLPELKTLYYSWVLDACKSREKIPDQEDEYKDTKEWKYLMEFSGNVSKLLGDDTGYVCSDVYKFLDTIGGMCHELCNDVSELEMKAVLVLVCHRECDGCKLSKGKVLKLIRSGTYTAEQMVTMIDELVGCIHCDGDIGNLRLFTMLERLKTYSISYELRARVFSAKLVSWVLGNSSRKISNKMSEKPAPPDVDIAIVVQSEYNMFMRYVEMNENEKKAEFVKTIQDLKERASRWSGGTYTWNKSLEEDIDNIFVKC